MQIIDKLVIVHPSVNIWGGRKKLESSELGQDLNLPTELINLGSKRVVSKESLRPFETLKKKLHRTIAKYGVQLIGGYAVAEDRVDPLIEEIKKLEDEFAQLKSEFIVNFDQHVKEQTENYPGWAETLQAAATEIQPTLPDKFGFSFRAYKIVPPKDMEEGDLPGGLNQNFVTDDEFVMQATSEVAARADEIIVRLSGHEELKQISLKAIRSLREKLINLSSLDRKLFGGAVAVIDRTLGEMPASGPITGRERKLVTSLLILLRSLDQDTHKTALLNGEYDTPEGLLDGMRQGEEKPADAQEELDEEVDEEEEETEGFVWF